jgi:hypothetical protein
VAHICDARLREDRCDEHPIPLTQRECLIARHRAEKMIADGREMAREGERLLVAAQDLGKARREYDRQVEATFLVPDVAAWIPAPRSGGAT